MAALYHGAPGETFNLGTGIGHSVNCVLKLLQQNLGTTLSPRHVDAVPGELRYSVADISKSNHFLGYAPKHKLEVSLPKVVEEIVADSHPELVANLF
jgi:UDP-glucose 4-epimerase